MERKGLAYSGLLHLLLLVFIIFGLPEFFERTRIEEPMVVTVDILPLSDKSNVKPREDAPKPKKEEPEKEAEKKPEPKKPVPKVKTAPPQPPKPKPAPQPDAKTKPKPEKVEKTEEKPKPEEAEDDLEAVLRSVAKTAREEEEKEKSPGGDSSRAISDAYDPSQPLTLSERDLIRNQFKKCWNVPAGARDAHELIVLLRVKLNADGSLISVELADGKARYMADSFFRAAADSAIRAVYRCTPLRGLPPDKYSRWQDMELTFDPKEMLF